MLLTGHYTTFCKVRYMQRRGNARLNKCPQCAAEQNEFCYVSSRPCKCALAIPGQVPANKPFTKEHFDFLRFLNGLVHHEMFEFFHKDEPYPIDEEDVNTNAFEQDGVTECVSMWTDGS